MARPKGSGLEYRPEDYVEALCEWLSGGNTLAAWSRLEGNPTTRTVHTWMREFDWFASAVARAREIGYGVIADDCIAIADDDTRDWLDGSCVSRAKLRVETRQKLLACWDPRRYGNKVAVGGDADAPPIKVLSSVERAHRLQVLLAQVAERAVAPPQLTDDDVMS